ncbi:unnamed protein product [Amoebophrya sp. A25]|nr:unnamed protein product [Amoebophrya sp. A25]|eukprot:GSA25T00013258001.1
MMLRGLPLPGHREENEAFSRLERELKRKLTETSCFSVEHLQADASAAKRVRIEATVALRERLISDGVPVPSLNEQDAIKEFLLGKDPKEEGEPHVLQMQYVDGGRRFRVPVRGRLVRRFSFEDQEYFRPEGHGQNQVQQGEQGPGEGQPNGEQIQLLGEEEEEDVAEGISLEYNDESLLESDGEDGLSYFSNLGFEDIEELEDEDNNSQ